ncbi:nose resistant to fluoxetine protein 6-like isoform X2 [Panulirus ornatus]|uniref:nose resistant to fluoxetine protein 6-like isoform X2 n=1 Tax=Panulirus ornatus TaxID=150431 RepID=UPI003A841BF0
MMRVWGLLAMCIVSCVGGPPLRSSSLAQDHNSIQESLHPRVVVEVDVAKDQEDLLKDGAIHYQEPDEEEKSWAMVEEATKALFPGPLWTALDVAQDHDGDAADGPPPLLQESGGEGVVGGGQATSLAGYYLPHTGSSSSSDSCTSDVQVVLMAIMNEERWALKMVDSWGKLPDGVLDGNTQAFGSLDECLSIHVEPEGSNHFKGQYCLVSLKTLPGNETEEEVYETDARPRILTSMGSASQMLAMSSYGTCLPSTCTGEQLAESLEVVLEPQGLNVSFVMCQTDAPPTLDYNAGDVIMIVVLTLLCLTAVAATVVDVWIINTDQQDLRNGRLKYLLVFSIYTNLTKMFRINTSKNKEVISCLHGMRVMSMTWVVWCHQYLITISVTANKHTAINKYLQNSWMNQIILNAFPSVDSFFFMSGLLVAYGLTKEFERKKRFNPLVYYVHRFIRLSPPILLLSGFLAVFSPLLVRGVLAPSSDAPGSLSYLCRRYWWIDGLFITNYFFNGVNMKSCLPVCWYTAVDFQLFLVTPLIFLPLLYRRKPGAVWLGCVTLLSVMIPAIITGVNHLPPTQVTNAPPSMMEDEMKLVYTKPWCRAPPYLMGMWLGYILWTCREKVTLKKWQVVGGWCAAIAMALAVIFGLQDYNTFSDQVLPYDPVVSILYSGLHRLAWGAALLWVVFACHNGYGASVFSNREYH